MESSRVPFSRVLPQFKHLNLISTEPILQWNLGTKMTRNIVSKLYPHVIDLKVTKCPCANDVALLGFLLNSTLDGKFNGLLECWKWRFVFLSAI